MLDPANPLMLALLWLTLGGVLTVLAVRTFRRDQREYRRFKRFRTTKRRQKMLRRWLLISFTLFGGLALLTLLASGAFAAPLLADVQSWPWVSWLLDVLAARPSLTAGVLVGLAIGVIAVTVIAIISVRNEGDEVVSLGDVQAILPRNRQELVLGGLLSINAGIVEELLFRLALPALLFATTGNAIVAVVLSLLLFGLMHSYQGLTGIIVTTVLGAVFMAIYVLTGSILITIIAHALLDLRSLVLIPMAIGGVHRIDGRRNPLAFKPTAKPATPATLPEAEGAGEGAAEPASSDTAAEAEAPTPEPAPETAP
ncbi:CPBP family intramembrane metalloprotease [Salinibacterium sp. NSLL150]|uniref:CPBP family intramembrane glutamic endopeptidase n=1 Tax=unclassified Salinibacterium TaxID=2632331 RepID=UPI0018CDA7AA|nr:MULTISPECIES: CPBP family intramembrane glutamic endopeptidase [unclassified Salinibacterium]MBH0099630.1 CPBP family intramembrane metalloprotease [Salinibacterium sp. NSLL35]MBH0102384.1 CPBP family intramembrane metalloprotease [Salinibacterium sp. NSLL150]MBH0105144.1 CPBP family intramembrane metalloprotease [Salinibacterium sp. NSLL16]MBH0107904.1 CPBP family intramembrane metalloprotease [Salinibacterium sp. NSLL17]